MSLGNSLLVALIVMTIVFSVLILLSFLVKIQSLAVAYIEKKGKSTHKEETNKPAVEAQTYVSEATAGELKLIDTDERTAAMVMAIVSDELKIPLNELQFKSIKALD